MKVENKGSDIKLKHVGNRVLNKFSYRSEGHPINQSQGKGSRFHDE